MKTRIQVLSIKEMSGIGKKSGQPYKMFICQCVVHGENIVVGEMVLPKDHPHIEPGFFDAEFGVMVGQDKRITGQLVQLYPADAKLSSFDQVDKPHKAPPAQKAA